MSSLLRVWVGLILGLRTKIPQASWYGLRKKITIIQLAFLRFFFQNTLKETSQSLAEMDTHGIRALDALQV